MTGDSSIREAALRYHELKPAGKIEIISSKPMDTQQDLALAYSPGVAAACEKIQEDPQSVHKYTIRGNLVAVITNGTAVLGLGAIGPLASKPVMEGKAILFKKFAGINSVDIEIDAEDPKTLVDIIAPLEPSFGGINLEDIRAPECFIVEEQLRKRMKIPVFHDDQHGTAIIASAGLINGLELVKKSAKDIKLVASGAGAASLACLDLMVSLGLRRENIWVFDAKGLVTNSRNDLDKYKSKYSRSCESIDIGTALNDADVLLGLSVAGAIKPEMIMGMAKKPIIFALANPVPEIMPDVAFKARPDAIIATGRSDFPNQINNVLCFPFLFRGALDVGATTINEDMKIAACKAIAALARREVSDSINSAYAGKSFEFGTNYIIPKPFDNRLILEIAPAVAVAAMKSGVATRPIKDLDAYKQELNEFVYKSSFALRSVFEKVRNKEKRVVFAEGEEPKVLRAVQSIKDEKLAKVILIGRKNVLLARQKRYAPRLVYEKDFTIVDPEKDSRYRQYWQLYHKINGRHGASPDLAKSIVRTKPSVIAALMVHRNEADAMICGVIDQYNNHFSSIKNIIGLNENSKLHAALSMLVLSSGPLFLCDTHINEHNDSSDISHMAWLAAQQVKALNIVPRIAFISHSNFGAYDTFSAKKMREATKLFSQYHPDIEAEGEMHTDAALNKDIRLSLLPDSRLKSNANILVLPSLDSANATYNALKIVADGQLIGPLLLGTKLNAHIVTNSVTSRGLFNLAAISVAETLVS